MTWMEAVSSSEFLPLRSWLGRGAAISCDECSLVYVRRSDVAVIFPDVAHAIASATTFCEGWEYDPALDRDGDSGRLVCVDCVMTREAGAFVEVRPAGPAAARAVAAGLARLAGR